MLSEAGEEGGGVGPGPRVGTHTLHVVRHQRLGQLRDEGGNRRGSGNGDSHSSDTDEVQLIGMDDVHTTVGLL